EELGAVLHQERHAIAAAEPLCARPARDPVGGRVELAVRDAALLEAHEGMVRAGAGVRLDDVADRARRLGPEPRERKPVPHGPPHLSDLLEPTHARHPTNPDKAIGNQRPRLPLLRSPVAGGGLVYSPAPCGESARGGSWRARGG